MEKAKKVRASSQPVATMQQLVTVPPPLRTERRNSLQQRLNYYLQMT